MAEPKTAKSRRSLILASEVLDSLRAHRAHQASERLSWGLTTPSRGWSLPPRTVGPCTQRRPRACAPARRGEQGSRRSDSMTSGARSRRSCWPRGVHPKVVRPGGSDEPSSQGSSQAGAERSAPLVAGAKGGSERGQGGQAVSQADKTGLHGDLRGSVGWNAWAARGRRAIDPTWSASMVGFDHTGQSCPVVPAPREAWCS